MIDLLISKLESKSAIGNATRLLARTTRGHCGDGRAQERLRGHSQAHKTPELVSNAIIVGLRPLSDRVKTLTYDNGKEFAAHIQIDQALEVTGNFARHFARWGRGSNENFNGSLRQYVPKKRSMNTVNEEEITMI